MSDPLDTRKDYRFGALLEDDLDPDPVKQLRVWIEVAAQSGIVEANAMSLATVGPEHRPSSRMVLLRDLDARGLTFFTNYESRKAHELAVNPFACLNFWWGSLERQVRIEGRLERVSPEESDAYFDSRPYESQAASAASPQSQPITRSALEARVADLKRVHPDRVPRPAHWGGYRLIPDRFEFWQGRPARLHDRVVYQLQSGVWRTERLAP
jgi:pyridoxamine 5'-phosphate oxidase